MKSTLTAAFFSVRPKNVFFILAVASLLSGCRHNTVIQGPATPVALKTDRAADQRVLKEVENFQRGVCIYTDLPPLSKAKPTPTPSKAPTSTLLETASPTPTPSGTPLPTPTPLICGTLEDQRNTILYDLKSIIDNNYESYARNFQQTADTTTFAGEVGAATLTAVGTLVGTQSVKDILTTASTLTQSTNVSIQKNFYQKQTEYAILAQMDADRLDKWKVIVTLMPQSISKYSLSAGLNDLQAYKRAGTATFALTEMTQQAGAKSAQAKQDTNNVRQAEVPVLTLTAQYGTFTSGAAATFTLTVSNTAQTVATNGDVTVTETLPAGLTLQSMAGSSWNCTNATCTRNDPLPAKQSYDAITVQVTVTAAKGTTLINSATVSGGGAAPKTIPQNITIQ